MFRIYIFSILASIVLIVLGICTYLYAFGIAIKASNIPEYFLKEFPNQENIAINYEDTTFTVTLQGSNLSINADLLNIKFPDLAIERTDYLVIFIFSFPGQDSTCIDSSSR